MISIRRSWLAPAVLFTIVIYYFYHRSISAGQTYQVPVEDKSSVHLGPYTQRYPADSFAPLPSEPAKKIPKIQYDFSRTPESEEAKKVRLERQAAVKESFLHSWEGYKKYAWAKDEVSPLSGGYRDSFGGWGATLVDTMDTLWIMGLKDDFEKCIEAVREIDFTTNTETQLNVFETTIRYLGGLLAAYDLSEGKYPELLEKAKELAELLYIPFDTPNRMVMARWEWKKTALGAGVESSTNTLLAEVGSLSLEFTRMSQLTRDPKYFDASQRMMNELYKSQNMTQLPGLWPTIVDARNLQFTYNHFTFGGMADSTYEYLPKAWMLLGGLDESYKTMYETAIETAKKALFFRPITPKGEDILFSGNAAVNTNGEPMTEAEGQHLGCFTGGMVGIAAQIFNRPAELGIARKLVDGCIWAYDQMPTGLMPELLFALPCHYGAETPSGQSCAWSDETWYQAVANRHSTNTENVNMSPTERGKYWVKHKQLPPGFTDLPDNRYILRPEAIESVFILYRITGDATLQEAAWKMFQSIEKATRTDFAHAGVVDVRQNPPQLSDRMESFWLAETLKYFYLIFADPNEVSLDEWVLNTEAHPLRRPRASERLS